MALGALIISLSLLVTQPQAVSTQEETLTESKRMDIERLLQLTTAPLMTRMISEIAVKDVTESLQAAFPDLTETGKTAAIEETRVVVREYADELLRDLYPVYNKLFTQAEIREVLAFYDTPLGRKLLVTAPEIESEATSKAKEKVGTLYPRITQRVLERLQKEGFLRR